MNPDVSKHSHAWTTFTYANVIVAAVLTFGGLWYLPLDLWTKGYMLMGVTMLVSSTITATKTTRDVQESRKLVNKIEDAKTEQLLMRIKEWAPADARSNDGARLSFTVATKRPGAAPRRLRLRMRGPPGMESKS